MINAAFEKRQSSKALLVSVDKDVLSVGFYEREQVEPCKRLQSRVVSACVITRVKFDTPKLENTISDNKILCPTLNNLQVIYHLVSSHTLETCVQCTQLFLREQKAVLLNVMVVVLDQLSMKILVLFLLIDQILAN